MYKQIHAGKLRLFTTSHAYSRSSQDLKWIAILASFFWLQSCAFKSAQDDAEVVAKEEPAPILDQESLPIEDVLEEDFCYDDVYATYLRESYVKEHSEVLKKYRSRRSRNAKRKSIE